MFNDGKNLCVNLATKSQEDNSKRGIDSLFMGAILDLLHRSWAARDSSAGQNGAEIAAPYFEEESSGNLRNTFIGTLMFFTFKSVHSKSIPYP